MSKAKRFARHLSDVAQIDPNVYSALQIKSADVNEISLMDLIEHALANAHDVEIRFSGSSVPAPAVRVGIAEKPLLPVPGNYFGGNINGRD